MKRFGLFWLVLALFFCAQANDRLNRWIDDAELPPLVAETSTEVLARDGSLLRVWTVSDGRWRLGVSPDGVDPRYLEMLIAFEDQRFYRHNGVDALAIVRAGAQLLRNGRVVSGASTLTMQVARLLEDGPTGSWSGKRRQIRLALALERRLSKEEILTLYLNRAPFGGNLEGVRAASLAWFGKEPARLTPAEAALLIALPQSPETRRPDRHPDRARAARNRVLSRMSAQGVLPEETAKNSEIETISRLRRPFPQHAPHLAEAMRRRHPGQSFLQLTIDAQYQRLLEELAREVIADRGRRQSMAILVADHRSGEILASVGSAAWRDDNRQGFVDMTRALRSPGSTLKPLIYGLAFDQGLAHPETLIDDRPTVFGTYFPQNFDGAFRGRLRVREALQQSLNVPVVSLLDAMGPAHLMAGLRRAGTEPVVPGGQAGLAVGLGGVGLSLHDLVTLYAGLANGGTARRLWADTTRNPEPTSARIIGPEAAWHIGDILSGLAPPPNAPATRLAYKTGTSYGHRDAWAIGFDGAHVIGVWMGRPDGTPVPGVFGGDAAAPILFEAFSRLKPRFDPLPPPPPATLIVSGGELPRPLQVFQDRNAVFEAGPDTPQVAFPPDGANLLADGPLTLRVRNGVAPFTWLMNGAPVALATRERETQISNPPQGFLDLTVIDARGKSDNVRISLN